MKNKRPVKRRIGAVIMAAGQGTRMRCPSVHKVCFPLCGKPVINRTIETLSGCGINSHFVVINHLAEQVMHTVSSAPGTHYFCYQKEPRGTGNAAKAAAEIIKTIPQIDDVLVIAGDKVIEESVLKKLITRFYETNSDLAFIAGRIRDFKSAGRIVCKHGKVAGIVEVFDIALLGTLAELKKEVSGKSLPALKAERIIISRLGTENKAKPALGGVWKTIKEGRPLTKEILQKYFPSRDISIRAGGEKITRADLSKAKYANLSVYMFKRKAFLSYLKDIGDNNAQKEEYLTDIVGIMAADGAKITVLAVDSPSHVMAFNTPEELIDIEKRLAGSKSFSIKEKPEIMRRPLDWLRHMETLSSHSLRYFRSVYGTDYPSMDSKRSMLIAALKEYVTRFGNNPVIITRAPGRINLMGRHIDHQGGDVNMMALDRDIYCISGKRDDRQISAHSIEPRRFHDRQFSISALEIDGKKDWHSFINSARVKTEGSLARGDWGQYVKAVMSRFQHFSGEKPLNGMNMLTASDLPAGGGISSSSALFVSMAEACVLLNNLSLSREKFVELCGEGEQYVGTRGGSGDHAAIKYSGKGAVTQIGFSPLKKIRAVPFPEGYVLAVCSSQRQAHKTKGARNIFNQKVACYHIGTELLKKQFPRLMGGITYLRDIVYGETALPEKDIFSMMRGLPLEITAEELLKAGITNALKMRIESLPPFARRFRVREVFIYGLAECARSRRCGSLLLRKKVSEFGRWMNVSHNGDRVVRWKDGDTPDPFYAYYSDKEINALLGEARPQKSAGILVAQPGAYRCSIPEIDKMVDISLSVKGVTGAQISGAGMGGCIMALVKKNAYGLLEKRLREEYYDPLNLEQEMFVAYPAEGSGAVRF